MRWIYLPIVLPGVITCILASCLSAEVVSTGAVPSKVELYEHLKDAFKDPVDRPGRLRVLFIGDSISIGCTVPLRKLLGDGVSLHRIPENGRDTAYGLSKLDAWLGDKPWDLIVFNWGLWDICYRNPAATTQGHRDKLKGVITATPSTYATNMTAIVDRLRKSSPALLWVETTPVPENEIGRFAGDETRYNRIADDIMRAHGIPVCALHDYASQKTPGIFAGPGEVHYTPQGYDYLAVKLAEDIKKIVTRRN